MTAEVPPPDAPLGELWRFALTFNGYERLGGFEATAELANGARERWNLQSTLPAALDEARCALFFEQRRWRHFGYDPAGEDEQYIRALVQRVLDLSGGQVDADDDVR